MDLKEIGICGLLLGVKSASQKLGVAEELVKAYMHVLVTEETTWFEKLKDLISEMVRVLGYKDTSSRLSLSSSALELITGTQTEKVITPKAYVATSDCTDDSSSAESVAEELKKRTQTMYSNKVKPLYISNLYELPSPKVVHSWNKKTKKTPIKRQKIWYSKSEFQTALAKTNSLKDIARVSQEMGVSKKLLKALKETTGQRLLESDQEADSYTKFSAIESFYLHQDLEKAVQDSNFHNKDTIRDWVLSFEKTVDGLFKKKKY